MDFILKIFFERCNIVETAELKKDFLMLVYYTAYNISYRSVGEKFGIPSTTVFRHINYLLMKFNRIIGPIYIKRPLASEMPLLSAKFSAISDLRGSILAIDGTHIPIDAPADCPERYVNRKGWHSVVMQLVVDPDYVIRDVFGGYPGSCHDAFIYSASSFKDYVNNEISEPYTVIGDSAYPSSDHLTTPFKGILMQDQLIFNNKLSSQRMRIECTIGRLKGRFKRFRCPSKNGEKRSVLSLFYFACIIHNIIELHKIDSAEDYYLEYLEDENYEEI
jgi:hypothetical protein